MIITMPYGDHYDNAPQPTIEPHHLTWNTHVKLREAFGYPTDGEFFGRWLEWFYALSREQRTALRRLDLNTLNKDDYPSAPTP